MKNNNNNKSSSSSSYDSSLSPSSSSSSHQNWLSFSLSNNTNFNSSSNPNLSSSTSDHLHPHLSLFQAFSTSPVQRQDESPGVSTGDATAVLSNYPGGPKLENFLGGGATTTTTTTRPMQQVHSLGGSVFSSDLQPQHPPPPSAAEIYDSELKSIAASFLGDYSGGHSSEVSSGHKQQHNPLAVSEVSPTPKKNVESFGQRTSIYRGVTRCTFNQLLVYFK